MLPWLVCKTNPLASKLLAAKPVLLIQHITQGFSNTQPGTPSILIVKKKNNKKTINTQQLHRLPQHKCIL